MIGDLKPYPVYENSEEPWIGRLPVGWSLQRGKNLFRLRTEKSGQLHGLELLSVYTHIGVKPRKELEERGNKATTTDDYWIVKRGDIIVNKLLAWMGAIGVSHYDGVTSPAYDILRPIQQLIPDYYHFLFRTDIYLQQFKLRSRGIMEMRLRLYFDQLGQIPVIAPPLDEQAAIVRFLDHATRRLERAIRTKRKLITLLNEQKQAIIHRAVTRGLDPNVPMKPSGIPWLGEVPAHWEVTPLRRYWQVIDCKHVTVPFVDEGIPLASVVEVQSFTLDLSRCKKTTRHWYEVLIEGQRKPLRGDLIYCRNVSVGACALVNTELDIAMGQDVCLIRSNKQNQCFLNYLLHSLFMKHQLDLLLVGSTFKRINISEIKALLIIVPPKQEQDHISAFLDFTLADFDGIITRTEREIALLREYRTRLISDVVMGKVDVRGAAASLAGEEDEENDMIELDESEEMLDDVAESDEA